MHLILHMNLYRYLREHRILLPNLESYVFSDVDFNESTEYLFKMAPNLQNLCMTFRPAGLRDRYLTYDQIMEHVSFSTANLKKLHILIGPFDHTIIATRLLSKALYEFPSLLYTRVRLANGCLKYYRLKRDDVAGVMRYEYETTDMPNECDISSWDTLYSVYKRGQFGLP